MDTTTVIALFEKSVHRFPDRILLWEKNHGFYEGLTYAQTRLRVDEFAGGLLALGVGIGDRIATIAEGRNDWVVAELGILSAGAIHVPLSVKLSTGAELAFRLTHSESTIVVVSGSQASKIRGLRGMLTHVRHIILLDPLEPLQEGEMTMEQLCVLGRSFLETRREEYEARKNSVRGDQPANICYTSGTTADPKGVVLTHRNYTANVEQASAMFDIPESYCSLLILPWDHCFAHTAGIYTLMRNGASMASVQTGKTPMETLKNIPLNIREIRPSFLLSVPALAKNFRKSIESGIAARGKVVETLFRFGLRVAYAFNGDGLHRGAGWRILYRPLVRLFNAVLFSKVRENFGGRLGFFVGGGALLDIELQHFFYALGMPMLQGYGLTESSPVISANTLWKHKLGSSGLVVPNLELRIENESGQLVPTGSEGEIVVRGENVMAGYWKNERATCETIRDGWLHTGDLGYIDNDGFLFVLGRTKSLLIAHDGEKYSPEGIEEALSNESKYIDQVMLYNNQSPYTVCLLVPNKDAILAWLRGHGHSAEDEEGQRLALGLLRSEIDAYREGGSRGALFPDRWLPSAIAVVAEGFTEQNGLLNSTLKIVRARIVERHQARIAALFTVEGKDVMNAENRRAIASLARDSV
ncbi:MAG TPA: AMP-binding protein [Bacteroidota bacterium]|nr:AMP-binding protein [Bacteroidota bacterium]